jgi:hypothetical protein
MVEEEEKNANVLKHKCCIITSGILAVAEDKYVLLLLSGTVKTPTTS